MQHTGASSCQGTGTSQSSRTSPLAFLFGSDDPRAVIVSGFVVNDDRREGQKEENTRVVEGVPEWQALLSMPRLHRLLYIPAALLWSRAALAGFGGLGDGVRVSGMLFGGSLSTSVPVISTLMFMMSLRSLNSHKSSKRGNLLGMAGAALAVGSVFLTAKTINTALFLPVGIGAGVLGLSIAQAVSMEQMPELVASFHSLTGLAAVLVSLAGVLPGAARSEERRVGKECSRSV